MSYLLRQGAINEKIYMDCYMTMAALLDWLNKDLHHHLDSEDITWIIDNNDKVRFSIAYFVLKNMWCKLILWTQPSITRNGHGSI